MCLKNKLFLLDEAVFGDYYLRLVGQIAQSVEQRTENPRVPSSILGLATSLSFTVLLIFSNDFFLDSHTIFCSHWIFRGRKNTG